MRNSRSPYRGVGIDVTGLTLDEQIEKAGLDWQVKLSPYNYGPEGQYESKANYIAYRSDSGAFLDHYGPQRKPRQNRNVIEAMHEFCDSSNLDISVNRIGCLEGGKSIFATARLDYEIDVANVGDITSADLVLKEHHKMGATQVFLYFNRLWCTNGCTERVKVKGLSLVHGRSMKTSQIQRYLENAQEVVDNYALTMNKLAQVTIEDPEAKMHLVKAFGDKNKVWDEQPRAVRIAYNLFKGDGLGSNELSAFQTLYGLRESISEYQNWYSRDSRSDVVLNGMIGGSRTQAIKKFERQLVSVAGL